MDFKVKFPGRKKVPNSAIVNTLPTSSHGDSSFQQRRLSQNVHVQNELDKSFDGLFDNQKYAFPTSNQDMGTKCSLFPNAKRQAERPPDIGQQHERSSAHETMSSDDAYKTIPGPSPKMLQNPFDGDKTRNVNEAIDAMPLQLENTASQRQASTRNVQTNHHPQTTSSPRQSFGNLDFQIPNQKMLHQSTTPFALLSPARLPVSPVPFALPQEQPGLEVSSEADNTLPRNPRASFTSSIHSNGSIHSPQATQETFQAFQTSGFYPSPSPFQSSFQPSPNSLTTPVDYSSYEAAPRPAEPLVSSSSGRRAIANPFSMRALSDTMRSVVLDQGLSATLSDGKIVEISALDVAACRRILESWTTNENSNGISCEYMENAELFAT